TGIPARKTEYVVTIGVLVIKLDRPLRDLERQALFGVEIRAPVEQHAAIEHPCELNVAIGQAWIERHSLPHAFFGLAIFLRIELIVVPHTRSINVLEVSFAERRCRKADFPRNLLVNRRRYPDVGRLGDFPEPGGDVDAVAKEIVVLDDDV